MDEKQAATLAFEALELLCNSSTYGTADRVQWEERVEELSGGIEVPVETYARLIIHKYVSQIRRTGPYGTFYVYKPTDLGCKKHLEHKMRIKENW